jgi:hypothetical protein
MDTKRFLSQLNVSQIERDLLPPSCHACARQLDVWANEALFKTLSRPIPNDDRTTALDSFLHLAFVKAGDDDFNARL